jgi:hypothetical protein
MDDGQEGSTLRTDSAPSPTATPAESAPADVATEPLPGVREFFAEHRQFGSIQRVEPMPDWAQGQRQQVYTDEGAYLAYLKGDRVVTLYLNDAQGRKEVWRQKE